MIDTSFLTVHACTMPGGAMFFWGTRDSGGVWDAADFKQIMFAWHAPSFYGTFVTETEFQLRDGVTLSALEALDYFVSPSHAQHVMLKWSDNTEALRKLAPELHAALAEGRFMPSFERWRAGEIGWKLTLPDETQRLIGDDAEAWIAALVPEWAAAHGSEERLQRLTQAYPLMRQGELPHDLWLDEDDWLVAIGWQRDAAPFRCCLQLVEPEDGQNWELRALLQDRAEPGAVRVVTSGGEPLPGEPPLPAAWTAHLARVRRDAGKWRRLLPWLPATAGDTLALPAALGHADAWRFLTEGSARLSAAGYTLFLPAWWDRVRRTKPRMRAKARAAGSAGRAGASMFGLDQIMQFDWKLAIGDIELTDEEFYILLEEKRNLMQIRGQWVQLDPIMLKQIEAAARQLQSRGGMSVRDAIALHLLGLNRGGGSNLPAREADIAQASADEQAHEEARKLQLEIELTDQLQLLIKALTDTDRIPLMEPPDTFNGELRRYQREGFSWLLFLRQFGLGGCLADDMGLGKTIQWISYLLAVKDEQMKGDAEDHEDNDVTGHRVHSPSLLICPTSVLGNWQMELRRFAQSLRVHLHYGPQRLKGRAFEQAVKSGEIDLVLTSYNLAMLDEDEFASLRWDSICLDEAQNIKNAHTKQASAIRRLDGFHRIAMTGTPIENRLTELWSIFEYVNPGYLGSERDFAQNFANRIERDRDPEALQAVQRLIRPFLLRRVKTDPAIQLDLPEKNETKVFVSLTSEQGSLYENYIRDMFSRIDRLSQMERRGHILGALTKLKQLCNHPALFLKEGQLADWRQRSNKVERLTEMVLELRQEGDKCLIFTQFVETGRLLQRILQEELGEQIPLLHGGSTKQARDAMIAHFQDASLPTEEQSNVFILSLRAGGIGLNLTAANHVFHFDRWWNPAVENQATDRAYRIGQTRNVQVHKFITLGTLEERIDELIENKLNLSSGIVGTGDRWITELSDRELKDLFALRTEWVDS